MQKGVLQFTWEGHQLFLTKHRYCPARICAIHTGKFKLAINSVTSCSNISQPELLISILPLINHPLTWRKLLLLFALLSWYMICKSKHLSLTGLNHKHFSYTISKSLWRQESTGLSTITTLWNGKLSGNQQNKSLGLSTPITLIWRGNMISLTTTGLGKHKNSIRNKSTLICS